MALPKRWYRLPTARLSAMLDDDELPTEDWVRVMDELDARAHPEPGEEPEDTPCIESGRDNCNDWGTGEGAYHGRI